MNTSTDALNIAAADISRRIQARPDFIWARGVVVSRTLRAIQASPSHIREAGGLSKIIGGWIDTLPAKYWVNHGSEMWSWTVVDELRLQVPAMRFDVQMAAANDDPTPPAPTSEVLDDYDALCQASRS